MRKIQKIAKLEFSILFYSPVAWLVLAIFMIQCGISFLDGLQGTQTTIALGYTPRPITGSLFGGNSGLFTVIQSYLYLYLPILTMGLMSRETSSGSIKLLLSSPVKLTEIILGKYLAIIGYGLVLMVVPAIFTLIGIAVIPEADAGLLLAGLLGLYFLTCTYAAIGLFMSCLTTYQVVAAISTLAVFAVLRFVGTLGQEIDFVRDLTYFLSISGRSDKMIAGLITTKDIFYYLIIIISFLALCVLRLKSERELKPWSVKASRYVVLLCGALLLGYLTSRPLFTGYLDATTAKSLTLTKASQELAAKIKGELKVTTYANMFSPQVWELLPASRNRDLSMLERFQRFIPGMKVSYRYFYEKPLDSNFADYKYNPNMKGITQLEKMADKMATIMDIDRKLFLPVSQLDHPEDLRNEGYLNVRRLEYNGKSTYLRFYLARGEQDPNPGEAEFMAGVKRLLVNVPKVVFLTGNNERSIGDSGDRGYQMISAYKIRRAALINQGFDIDTINLNEHEIPVNTSIAILADPATSLSAQAVQRFNDYLKTGGNMLILSDPERSSIINPVLTELGVQLKTGTLVHPAGKFSPDFTSAEVTSQGAKLDSNLFRMQRFGIGVAMQGAGVLETVPGSKFTVVPVLMSASGGWIRTSVIDPTETALRFDAAAGDQKGKFPVTLALSRKQNNRQQRILVSGDADFISNQELNRTSRGANEYYLQAVFRWLSNGQFPLDVTRPEPKDLTLSVSRDQITTLKYLCRGLIPALIAVMGAIVLFKRRRN